MAGTGSLATTPIVVPQPPRMKRLKTSIRPLYRRATSSRRALPDFVLIGAQRSGTTSLIRYLREHPAVLLERGVGEVHFFDNHYDRGERYYRSSFPYTSRIAEAAARAGGRAITGEKTPFYLFHPLVPERLARMLPDAKLLVIMREPVARTASQHAMNRRTGVEPLDLGAALDAEEARVEPALARLRSGARMRDCLEANYFSYTGRSRYAEQLQHWLQWFPREQLHLLRTEDLTERPAPAYAELLEFLELPPFEPAFAVHNAARTPYKLDAAIRARLEAMFAEPNRRLRDEFGISWG